MPTQKKVQSEQGSHFTVSSIPGPAAVPSNLFEVGALQQALIDAACRVEEMQSAHVARIEQLEAEVVSLTLRLARLRCVQKRSSARRRADTRRLAELTACHRKDIQRLTMAETRADHAVRVLTRVLAGLDKLPAWVMGGHFQLIPGLWQAIAEARGIAEGETR